MSRSALLCLIAGALLATAAPATAAVPRWQALDHVPHMLPPAGAHAAAAQPARWIVGARVGATAARIARAHGARAIDGLAGAYALPTARARAFAAALRARRLLRYAEPDATLRPASSFEHPDGPTPWARSFVVPDGLAPPASPAPIGFIDDLVDAGVADTSQAQVVKTSPAKEVLAGHGTAVASVAAGRADGQGVIGIAPGAPILSFGLKTSSCSEVVDGLLDLVDDGAKVINLSLGTTDDCYVMRLAIADAVASGALVVAAAGNEREHDNPVVFPADYPHVLSVGAVDVMRQPTYFSSSGRWVDLAAPGADVPVALPLRFDTEDGTQDGLSQEDGTSFAAPVVAGVASWLIAARPGLHADQYAALLRESATDLAGPGWDPETGFGFVDLAGTLQAQAPPADPREPNDGVGFVDGAAYGKPDAYLWRGGRHRTVRASVDAVKDPVDIYRMRLKRHERATIVLSPGSGDADLRLYDGHVKRLTRHPLSRSSRGAGARDVVHVANHRRHAHRYYVAVLAPDGKTRSPGVRYALRFTRRR